MGRQSSRLYFQGKDHKDIYFQGHYHDAMYIGNQLVWEKIDETISLLEPSDVGIGNTGRNKVSDCTMYNDGSLSFYVNEPGYDGYYAVVVGDSMNAMLRFNIPRKFNGGNFGICDSGYGTNRFFNAAAPEAGLLSYDRDNDVSNKLSGAHGWWGYINNYFIASPTESYFAFECSAIVDYSTGKFIVCDMFLDDVKIDSRESVVWHAHTVHNIVGDSFQWYNGVLYAHLHSGEEKTENYKDYGTCYTEDMFHWYTGVPISGTGVVINNILFLDNGVAVDTNLDIVGYTKKPDFYYNGYYYYKELEGSDIMRSKDLVNWENYKKLNRVVTLCGYWRKKRWLILKDESDNFYKVKMNL